MADPGLSANSCAARRSRLHAPFSMSPSCSAHLKVCPCGRPRIPRGSHTNCCSNTSSSILTYQLQVRWLRSESGFNALTEGCKPGHGRMHANERCVQQLFDDLQLCQIGCARQGRAGRGQGALISLRKPQASQTSGKQAFETNMSVHSISRCMQHWQMQPCPV